MITNVRVSKKPRAVQTGPGPKPPAGERQEIEDFLRLAFGIFVALDQESDGETTYDRLAAQTGPEDTLITLNYDTLLDSALWRQGWNPKSGYCLSGGRQKVLWRPAPNVCNPNMAKVRLLKLHGSVNWFVHGSFSNLAKIFESKPAKVTAPRKNEIKGYMRQIVPPIYGKFFRHSQWEQLWSKAYRALCDAEVLVVIGCSLIETDFHLRALTSQVCRCRKGEGRPYKRVFLVDRTRVRNKWRKALKGCLRACSTSSTFEKFLS